ncbi:uncharacterized protein [Montipora capricornis]
MQGEHPKANEGVVTRTACFSARQLCCKSSVTLLVRNCSGFYAYKLDTIPSIIPGFRVCGNGIEGVSSSTGERNNRTTGNKTEVCVNYKELDEHDRAAHYFSYHTLKCDANLPQAWYRFIGAAGSVMPTKCVPKLHCGTLSPGWLNGNHPTVGEGQVKRMICFTNEDNCCYWYTNVIVRNCGKFFVYKFGQFPASRHFCSLRYCGAGTQGCKDKDGNIYEVYKTWEPNPLITCKCMPGLQVSCRKTHNGCWTGEGKAYMNGQIWLKNSLSMCICINQNISCTNLSQPACTDENGVVKEHGSNWFAGACFNCTCMLGVVKCYKYHVSIQYGLLKIKALGTCVPCHRPWQDIRPSDNGTVSNCKVFFELKKTSKLFQCSNGAFIRKYHECNGISECGDGSDEKACHNVICRDERGQLLILKDTWGVTNCIWCKCVEGLLNCKRTLRVNFVGEHNAYVPLVEECKQPACSTVDFIRKKRHACEAMETTKGGRLILQGDTWEYQGCRFHFAGPKEAPGCKMMNGPWCQMYNGAVCCAKQCPALPQLANQMRWNVSVCPGGLQLAARNDMCDASHPNCLLENNFCNTTFMCSDEETNCYFDGVTWSVGDCIECRCIKGLISCTKTMTFVTSTTEQRIEQCSQPNCNIVDFLNSQKQVCKACRWKNQTLHDGYSWKENGVDFFCSSHERVKAGCYLSVDNIRCTGAFSGIRELKLLSDEELFLCDSGDEIRSQNDRCNKRNDCDDISDEKDCDQYYCPSHVQFNLSWNRTASETIVRRKCFEVDPALGGEFSSLCEDFSGSLEWKHKVTCGCEKKVLLQQFHSKLSFVNLSNLLEVADELTSEALNFTNPGLLFNYVRKLFNIGKHILTPVSPQNDEQTYNFSQIMMTHADLNEDNFNPRPDSFCSEEVSNYQRQSFFKDVKHFSCQAPNWTRTFEFCLIKTLRTRPRRIRYFPVAGNKDEYEEISRPGITQFWSRPVVNLKINYNQLFPARVGDASDSTSLKIMNETGVENNSYVFDSQAQQSNICSWLEFDANGSLRIRTKEVRDKKEERKAMIQNYLELVLSSISIAAVLLSLIILSCLRIKNSERIFVHKNLLVALLLIYIVMILDTFIFTNRKRTPKLCSAMAVIQHLTHLAIFTWMLVEGIHLYMKLVKVFSVRKLYITYMIIGWGLPVIIVGLIAAVRPQTYDMDKTYYKKVTCGSLTFFAEIIRYRCWLHDGEWLYKGPILALLLINVLIFLILLRVIFTKISIKFQSNRVQLAKKGLKSVAALLPLLGVTWLLGFIVQFSEVLLYLFIILNSTQGLLFCILHGLLDAQVKESLIRSLRRHERILLSPRDKKQSDTSRNTQLSLLDSLSRGESYVKHRQSKPNVFSINPLETTKL